MRRYLFRVWLPLGCLVIVLAAASQNGLSRYPVGSKVKVGPMENGSAVLPDSQVITPAGAQVELPHLRPQVLALSPDGRLLVTSGKTSELVVIDPQNGSILQHVPLPASSGAGAGSPFSHLIVPDPDAQASYTGLLFSPDGARIFLSSVNGTIKVFRVEADRKVTGLSSYSLPGSGLARRGLELPAGLDISSDNHLFVALTLSNRVAELDGDTGKLLRTFKVGAVPYGVLALGSKIYVSNWAGRQPAATSVTGPAGLGTLVRVDPVRYIASEGSISVIDRSTGSVTGQSSLAPGASGAAGPEISVGIHSCGMAASPDGRYLFVANAGSDTVSVMDTRNNSVVETISLRFRPQDPLGASPNAIAVDGNTLYVCCGAENAIAVIRFQPRRSRLLGLIPTGWYPGAIAYDRARRMIYVANIKGIGSWTREPGGKGYNSHQHLGTITMAPVPDERQLARYTDQVMENNRRNEMESGLLPPRPGTPPRPVPERAGEPSVFHHVVYIIKENRTYDQVLGDIKEGNGDPALCIFGEQVTPNQHKLSREFALLDNAYCSGVLSADGHQWADSAFATDYLERSFCGWPRSYPDGMEDSDVDSMAYSTAGFLWDNALAHGKSLRDYGEFTIGITGWKDSHHPGHPGFQDFYRDFKDHTSLTQIGCRPAIASLGPYIKKDTIGWNLDVPDVFRAAQFAKELAGFEQAGKMPDLSIICLPNDHTSGTAPGKPTPAAQVADNDLALGQIVEAISHSRFWRDTCIFAIEDDPQSGFDHVNSYRTTVYVVSPYTRRHSVVSDNYNQTSLVHTIELILGLPPMNMLDATAAPMTGCFTAAPDFTPFTSMGNNIPLDQLNPGLHALANPGQRRYALLSSRLPLGKADQCPDNLLNRILWQSQKGNSAAYPEWAISEQSSEVSDQ